MLSQTININGVYLDVEFEYTPKKTARDSSSEQPENFIIYIVRSESGDDISGLFMQESMIESVTQAIKKQREDDQMNVAEAANRYNIFR